MPLINPIFEPTAAGTPLTPHWSDYDPGRILRSLISAAHAPRDSGNKSLSMAELRAQHAAARAQLAQIESLQCSAAAASEPEHAPTATSPVRL